ncbi:MAG: hypothetical protein WBM25_04160 [Azonexus sp.]
MNNTDDSLNTIWTGANYDKLRILVLGESWYGDYADNSDAGYIRMYLDESLSDSMYSRMANACGLSRNDFCNGIAFTNFVQRIGDTRNCRPTIDDYQRAKARLVALLQHLRPKGVWILGIEQSKYSTSVIEQIGISCEITAHPTSYGLSNAKLGASWHNLVAKTQHTPMPTQALET